VVAARLNGAATMQLH